MCRQRKPKVEKKLEKRYKQRSSIHVFREHCHFCPTYEGFFLQIKLLEHLYTLDFKNFLFSKILILCKMGYFLYYFCILGTKEKL